MSAFPVVSAGDSVAGGHGSSPLGFVLEPLLVVSLLAGGVWFNRRQLERGWSPLLPSATLQSPSPSSPSPASASSSAPSATRVLGAPLPRDTSRFAGNWISTTLYRFPFLLEVLYWALTYWVYQIARAISAVLFIDAGTVETARRHAISLLELEQRLGIQWENVIQQWIMQRVWAITALNRIYSFVHIPATIAFLAFFYNTRRFSVYAPVRRTMALANLLAFVVFTLWPAMPPRLLPPEFGFIDTVHQGQMGSVWTTNRFCNQYAAMPSLHFGYSLIVGCSLFACPPAGPRSRWRRYGVHTLFLLYPATILLAIVATANHYIIDAIAGLFVAAAALRFNGVLRALQVPENYIFYALHIHKPPSAGVAERRARLSEEPAILPRFSNDGILDDAPVHAPSGASSVREVKPNGTLA